MCKDDDRVIESLVSQINNLQEKLKQYSTPEGIPEGLNEAEIDFITDVYCYYLRHKKAHYLVIPVEHTVRCEIEVSTYEESYRYEPDKKLQNQVVFNLAISGVNYQNNAEVCRKITGYLKKLLKSE